MDPDSRSDDFIRVVEAVRKKEGNQLLTDDDLIILAAEEISRTFTHEEKNYSV
ncbi:MAG: hypothetical protein GX556_15325 [Fibrobacter sp.]|nr:hypothetical protein [Fibrobacter sp.]